MSAGFHAKPFRPRRWLSNGHLQTIVGNFLPRQDHLPTATAELVEVWPATSNQISSQVLCHCHWQPEAVRAERLTVILLHGLEGSLAVAVHHRQRQQVVGRGLQCGAHEHAQLRRHGVAFADALPLGAFGRCERCHADDGAALRPASVSRWWAIRWAETSCSN